MSSEILMPSRQRVEFVIVGTGALATKKDYVVIGAQFNPDMKGPHLHLRMRKRMKEDERR